MAHKAYSRIIQGSNTVIVMIHGIIGTPDHFKDMIPLVPDDWSVYNLLLDGHGKQVRDFSASSMTRWKQQVASLMDQLSKQYPRIIIAAHSMGTLFAIQAALAHPERVEGLFLMGSCLRVGLKPLALSNAFKVSMGLVRPDDAPALAAFHACSIAPDKHLWRYLGWLPRYWELLWEIRRVRPLVRQVSVPCWVFQSRHDEMVSVRAAKCFADNSNILCSFLESSTHFHYKGDDYPYLLEQFQLFCDRIEKETQ